MANQVDPAVGNNGVVSEFQQNAYGQAAARRATNANTPSTANVTTGARLTTIGTSKSDGQRHNIGEDN
jgi:hypothetical protein